MMFRRVILKSILLVSIIGFSLSLHANQYTSIGNGNWSNVLIWSPFGFPLPTDTVVINSNVTLDSDWGITGAGIITINTGATLTEDIPGRVFFQAGGDLINNGTFNFSNFWLDSGQVYNNDSARFDQNFFIDEAGIFINNGVIANVDSAWNNGVFSNADPNSELICAFFYNTDSLFNDGSIGFLEGANEGVLENMGLIASVAFINDGEFENGIGGSFSAVDFWNDWKFVNLGNASVTVTRDFLNGDTLVPLSGPMLYNDGSFNVGRHFYNGDSIIGVTGQFCIGEYSLNYGYVGGSIDICDNTGSPSFDTNLGFVGPSVTSCASSCSMVVSVVENDVTCSGGTDGSVVLSVYGGSGSYTYLWNTGDSTDSIGGLTEGTYVVLITDGIDTSYVVANLKAPSVLYTINATTESTCDAENGTAAVTAF
ncbi:MAG: SprB repeat-containing protein, partial [Flavobacteriales bacterium]|nr:SprB repeat-containing protein [Flavobacteriales bacterium]